MTKHAITSDDLFWMKHEPGKTYVASIICISFLVEENTIPIIAKLFKIACMAICRNSEFVMCFSFHQQPCAINVHLFG